MPGDSPAAGIPPTIRIATTLIWALVALMAVRTALSFTFVDQPAQTYVPTALGSLLLLGGLLALAALNVRRGVRWARWLAAMFASLAAFGGLLGLAAPTSVQFTLIGLVSAAVAVTVIVLLFSGPAQAFFRRRGGRPTLR